MIFILFAALWLTMIVSTSCFALYRWKLMKLEGLRKAWEDDTTESIFVGFFWFIFLPYFVVVGLFNKMAARMQSLAEQTYAKNKR